jgi:outer membrane protein
MAVAADQMVRQARSAYYLTANGSLSSAYADHASRVAAGGLNNSIIYDRHSNGVMVKQLVTDFGRTRKLVISSSLHARAEQENIVTARANSSFLIKWPRLRATSSGDMDVSFANVDLDQARLLL